MPPGHSRTRANSWRARRMASSSASAVLPIVRQARLAQGLAARPASAAWGAAPAVAGKTAVLIARTLALMLAGTPPGRILCLTFTKAAAAEMANRLATRQGPVDQHRGLAGAGRRGHP